MLNKAVIQGRLTKDPELRTTQSGTPVATFTVAWSEKYKEQDRKLFLNCVAWSGNAEFVSKYFRKGSSIIVFGNIQVDVWKDKEGHNRRTTRIIVDELQFGESKNRDSSASGVPTDREGFSNASNSDFFTDMKDADGSDAELPF